MQVSDTRQWGSTVILYADSHRSQYTRGKKCTRTSCQMGVVGGIWWSSPGNFEILIVRNGNSCILGSFLQFIVFFPGPTVQQLCDDYWAKVATLPS